MPINLDRIVLKSCSPSLFDVKMRIYGEDETDINNIDRIWVTFVVPSDKLIRGEFAQLTGFPGVLVNGLDSDSPNDGNLDLSGLPFARQRAIAEEIHRYLSEDCQLTVRLERLIPAKLGGQLLRKLYHYTGRTTSIDKPLGHSQKRRKD